MHTIEPIDVPAAKLQEYTGRYPFRDVAYDVVIALENGRLFMRSFNNSQELVPVATDEFESVEGGRIEFERDASGRVTSLSLGDLKLARR